MIVDFTVENFGCIKETQTISFEATEDNTLEDVFIAKPDGETRLLRMVTLLGYHGSGKSTMLNALSTCKDSMFGIYNYRFLSEKQSNMSLNFIAKGLEINYCVKISKYNVHQTITTNNGDLNSFEKKLKVCKEWARNMLDVNGETYLHEYNRSLGENAYIQSRECLKKAKFNNMVVAIDNFGIGLSADYYEESVSDYFMNSKNNLSQIIVATHNKEFLKEKIYRNDSIYFAEKINGQSEFYSLSDFKDINPNTFKRKIYEWAWMGKIGGKSYPSHLHCED